MKIYLRAYVDKNLGDDLMIEALLKEFPEHDFYLFTKGEISSNLLEYQNLFINPNKLYVISKCDTLISLGGSIYQFNNLGDLLRRIKLIFTLILFKILGRKSASIGCNFGPFNIMGAKYLTKIDLKLRNIITVRDKFSYDFAREKGVNNIYILPDIVYQIDLNSYSTGKSKDESKVLGVSAFTPSKDATYNKLYFSEIASLCDRLIEEEFDELKLYCFQTGDLKDDYAAVNIKKIMKNKNVEIVNYDGDTKKFLKAFNKSDFLITTRFHSAILGHKLNIPFYPIIYSNKMSNLLNDYNYLGSKTNILKFEENESKKIYKAICERCYFDSKSVKIIQQKRHLDILKSQLFFNVEGENNEK